MLRSAFIGCGPRARAHAQAYEFVERGTPVAACARTPAHVDRFCREIGIAHAYTDIHQMLEVERPHLVHLVTAADQRVALMSIAAEHEIPVVLVEKPIALQGEDWRQLVELASRSVTKFVVNTQLHFHPRNLELQQVVADGRIGEVRFIDASAGSTILDQGVHLFELAHWYGGSAMPARVVGQMLGAEALSEVEASPDASTIAVEFSNGVRAQIMTGDIAPRISDGAPFYFHKRIAVYGTHGFIHWTMVGWERFTSDGGYEHGVHSYEHEDDRAQAALTDSAFGSVDPGAEPHPTRLELSLVQFNVILGAYMSALRREPVDLPCDPPDGLIDSLRLALGSR
jgi:predicted dehydrogenase